MDMTKVFSASSCVAVIILIIIFYFSGIAIFFEKKHFELNANGEVNQKFWIRDFKGWVPLRLQNALDPLYPIKRVGKE